MVDYAPNLMGFGMPSFLATFMSPLLGANVSSPPGGSDKQIQYNHAGIFGGIAGSSWDGTTFVLPDLNITGAPTDYALKVIPSGGTAQKTAFFQDTTPISGSTFVTIKAGAGQSSNTMFSLTDSGGFPQFKADGLGNVNVGTLIGDVSAVTPYISFATSGQLTFTRRNATDIYAFDSPIVFSGDTGLSHLGAASLALGNGTASDVSGTLSLASIILGTSLRLNVAPTVVSSAAVAISNAADAAGNIGHRIAFNLNGVTYWIPCGATAF